MNRSSNKDPLQNLRHGGTFYRVSVATQLAKLNHCNSADSLREYGHVIAALCPMVIAI